MKLSERIQSLFFRSTKIRHPAYALLGVMLVLAGCQTIASVPESSAESCLDKIARHVRKLPQKQVLTTLDGQDVNLEEFFETCAQNWPHCALYSKFYYWKNEVKTIKSKYLTIEMYVSKLGANGLRKKCDGIYKVIL